MKIYSAIPKGIKHYFKRNTLQAKFDRHVDCAGLCTTLLGGEILRMPHWQSYDFALSAMLGTSVIENLRIGFHYLKDLRKIKARAKNIHKISKMKKKVLNA